MTAPPRETAAQFKGQSQKRLHYHQQQLGSAGALTVPGFKHLVTGLSQWRSVGCGMLLHRHIHGLTKPKFFYPQGTVSGDFLSQAAAFADGSTGIQNCPAGMQASLARGGAAPQGQSFTSSPQLAEPLRECSVGISLFLSWEFSFLHVISVLHRGCTQLGSRKSGYLCSPGLHPRAYVQLPSFPGASLINHPRNGKLHFCFADMVLQCFFLSVSHP